MDRDSKLPKEKESSSSPTTEHKEGRKPVLETPSKNDQKKDKKPSSGGCPGTPDVAASNNVSDNRQKSLSGEVCLPDNAPAPIASSNQTQKLLIEEFCGDVPASSKQSQESSGAKIRGPANVPAPETSSKQSQESSGAKIRSPANVPAPETSSNQSQESSAETYRGPDNFAVSAPRSTHQSKKPSGTLLRE